MKRTPLWILLITVFAIGFTACDEDSTNEPVDPDVLPPTSLRAASADQALILHWEPSASEAQDNFGGYKILLVNSDTNEEMFENASRGDGHTVFGLDNGTRYDVQVWAVTTQGKQSTASASIEWAPAIRREVNQDDQSIRVYATTSSQFNSGLDMFNPSGICEVIPQASQEFVDRGDLYVDAPNNTSNFLEISSPHTASNFTGQITQFSTVYYNADDLDEHTVTTPPISSTYTNQEVTITNADVDEGRIIYGRLKRGTDFNYFRLLVHRGSNGKLVQGDGADRYVEFSVSFQHIKNVPFAKK